MRPSRELTWISPGQGDRRQRPDHQGDVPTPSETIGMTAEAFEGTITDLYIRIEQPQKAL